MQDFPHVKSNWIKAIKAIRREGAFADGFIRRNIQATGLAERVSGKLRSWEVGSATKSKMRGHWHRKANKGIWAGVFR